MPGLSHPPLLTGWRQDVSAKQGASSQLTRTRALRPTLRREIDEQTDADLRVALGQRYEVLSASTGLRVAAPGAAASVHAAPAMQPARRLVETPGAVYKHVWSESAQPLGENTFALTRKKGYEPKSVPKPRSDPQSLQQWFKEYGAPDPNVRLMRPSEFTPSVRLIGNGEHAFRTNVRSMKRGTF
jgi:hypothetical protein